MEAVFLIREGISTKPAMTLLVAHLPSAWPIAPQPRLILVVARATRRRTLRV
jgi:hypothetical protein